MIKGAFVLTPKQEKFAQLYVQLGNASDAYRQAYNVRTRSMATINRTAHGIANKPNVAARIAVLRAGAAARNEVSVDYVVQRLKREAETAKNPSDRIAALSWLGRHLALFTDRQQVDERRLLEIVVHRLPVVPSGGTNDGKPSQ